MEINIYECLYYAIDESESTHIVVVSYVMYYNQYRKNY